MANNRMYIICNICEPTWKISVPKAGFFLGKWYPGSYDGYWCKELDGKELDKFIQFHAHNNHEHPLRLEYECNDEERLLEKELKKTGKYQIHGV
ncbi:MAG: hypothetical protein AABY15_00910 [Nanoarchaeota archaeon]